MAKVEIILKYLYNTRTLSYLTYLHRMESRKGKRSKGDAKYKSKNLVSSNRILVDMIVSPLPDFIMHIASLLTKKWYEYTTMYIIFSTRLGYVYLQTNLIVKIMLQGK